MKTKIFTLFAVLFFLMSLIHAEDIYVAGAKQIGTPFVAGYWKNGTFTQLGEGTAASYGLSLFVSGTDVYVGGYEKVGTPQVARLWKNGVSQTITSVNTGNANSSVQSVFVSGSTVYCAGYDKVSTDVGRVAVFWKDGVALKLGTRWSSARSVFVAGDYVYVAGQETGTLGKSEAKYWKIDALNNVTEVLLDGSSSTNDFYAISIFVDGEDVYVAGYEYYSSGTNVNIPKYWKNGVAVNLSTGTALATGETTGGSIFVDGENIHVAGYENYTTAARYWKNGVQTDLTLTDLTKSKAKSVYVYNNDVYIAGWGVSSTVANLPVYWKNGILTQLETTQGDAFAIAVVDTPISTDLKGNESEKSINLFYDWSADNITIKGVERNVTFQLCDLNGKKIVMKTISGNTEISLNTISTGVYIARIIDGNNIARYKFVK